MSESQPNIGNRKRNIVRYLKLLLKIVVALGSLYYVYTKIDTTALLENFRIAHLGLLFLALVFFAVSKLISSFRLNQFFSAIGVVLSQKSNLKLYVLGMFYNFFLPGGIGGDGYKIYLLSKYTEVKAKKIFWAVFLDRVTGLTALFCLAVLLSIFIHYNFDYKYFTLVLIPLVLIISYVVIKYFFSDFLPIFFSSTFSSFLVQIAQTISALLILYSLQVTDHTLAYLAVFLISSIVAALPISIGGIGSREITFLFGAQILGLDINSSVALSLLFYIITALVSIAGIYYSFKTENVLDSGNRS